MAQGCRVQIKRPLKLFCVTARDYSTTLSADCKTNSYLNQHPVHLNLLTHEAEEWKQIRQEHGKITIVGSVVGPIEWDRIGPVPFSDRPWTSGVGSRSKVVSFYAGLKACSTLAWGRGCRSSTVGR
jgi:hypothetical protein